MNKFLAEVRLQEFHCLSTSHCGEERFAWLKTDLHLAPERFFIGFGNFSPVRSVELSARVLWDLCRIGAWNSGSAGHFEHFWLEISVIQICADVRRKAALKVENDMTRKFGPARFVEGV